MGQSFKVHMNPVLEFANGYQIFFEPGGIAPYSVFVHIWNDGNKIPVDVFDPNNANGYLSSDAFARLLYKVSQALPVVSGD